MTIDYSQLPVPTIFLYSIVAAAALIYAPFLVVSYARFSVGYDMYAPRTLFDKLPPYGQRATWAHQNSFETFLLFVPAAIIAYVTGVDSDTAVVSAIAFPVARLLYSTFYILNIPLLRSLMFAIGGLSSGTLYVLSIMQATK
jgi:uncharacterized MAPEG superfamily protein